MITIDIEEDALKVVGSDEQGGVWSPSDTFDKEDHSIVGEYKRQQWEISDGLTQIEQITALEDIFTEAGDDISEQAEQMLQVTLESIATRLGLERPAKPALESFKTKHVALEGLGGYLKQIWERIVEMFKKMCKAVHDWVGKMVGKENAAHVDKVKREGKEIAKSAPAAPKLTQVGNGAVQHFKHLGNNFDIKALNRDLAALHASVKAAHGFDKVIGEVLGLLNKLVEERIEGETDLDPSAIDAVFAPLNAYTSAHFPTLTDRAHYSVGIEAAMRNAFPHDSVRVQHCLALRGLASGIAFLALEHNHPTVPVKYVYDLQHPNYSDKLSDTFTAMVPDVGSLQTYAGMIEKVGNDFDHAADNAQDTIGQDKYVKNMERIRDLVGKKKSPWLSAAPAMYRQVHELQSAALRLLQGLSSSIHSHWGMYEIFIKQYRVEKTS